MWQSSWALWSIQMGSGSTLLMRWFIVWLCFTKVALIFSNPLPCSMTAHQRFFVQWWLTALAVNLTESLLREEVHCACHHVDCVPSQWPHFLSTQKIALPNKTARTSAKMLQMFRHATSAICSRVHTLSTMMQLQTPEGHRTAATFTWMQSSSMWFCVQHVLVLPPAIVILVVFSDAIVLSPTCCMLAHRMCTDKIFNVAQNVTKDFSSFFFKMLPVLTVNFTQMWNLTVAFHRNVKFSGPNFTLCEIQCCSQSCMCEAPSKKKLQTVWRSPTISLSECEPECFLLWEPELAMVSQNEPDCKQWITAKSFFESCVSQVELEWVRES